MKNKEIEKRLKDSLDYEFDLSFNERKELLSYIEQIEKDKKKAELGEHYKHLYSEVKKQKDNGIDWIKNNYCYVGKKMALKPFSDLNDLLRMLGEIDE